MNWILQVKFGCLLEQEALFPSEVICLGTNDCTVGIFGLHYAGCQARWSPWSLPPGWPERFWTCSKIIWETCPRKTSRGVFGQAMEQAFISGPFPQCPEPLLFTEQKVLKLFPTPPPTSKNRATEMIMGTGRNGCYQQLNDLLRHFNPYVQSVTLAKWPARWMPRQRWIWQRVSRVSWPLNLEFSHCQQTVPPCC